MEKFSARAFYATGGFLARVKSIAEDLAAESEPITADGREALVRQFTAIAKHCRDISLVMSAKSAERTANALRDGSLSSHADIARATEDLDARIRDEMEGRVFMHLSLDAADYYGKEQLFGEMVATKFPSAAYDVKEAGNCYATARYTGAVFHLMRSLEVALTALGKEVGVDVERSNWQATITQIEAKVRGGGSDLSKGPGWKAQREQYSQAISHFVIFKDAWRNYTMHARGKYTQEEAQTIFAGVKAFMQKLSEFLCESTVPTERDASSAASPRQASAASGADERPAAVKPAT